MEHDVVDCCLYCPARPGCTFSDLPDGARSAFRTLTRTRFFSAGETIVRQGDAARGVFVVRSGLLRLRHVTPGGRATLVRLVAPAGIVGLPETLSGDRHSATVEALERSQLEYVEHEDLHRFLLDNPEAAMQLLSRVGEELHKLELALTEVSSKLPLPERMLHKLQELAELCGSPDPEGILLDAPLTVQDLADSLGCSRQWASELLGRMQDDGLITRRQRRIVLTGAACCAYSPGN